MWYRVTNLDKTTMAELKKFKILTTKSFGLAMALLYQGILFILCTIPLSRRFKLKLMMAYMDLSFKLISLAFAFPLGNLSSAIFSSFSLLIFGANTTEIYNHILNNSGQKLDVSKPYEKPNNNNNNNNNGNSPSFNRRRFRGRPQYRGRSNNRIYYRNSFRNNNNNIQNRSNYRNCLFNQSDYCVTHNAFCTKPKSEEKKD